MEVQKDSPKQEGVEEPWRELVPRFSGTSAGVYETVGIIQTEYGFKHCYQSDTDSTVTRFDILHEDDLEAMHSMQSCDHQALKEKGMLPCLSLARILIVTPMSPPLPDDGRSAVQEISAADSLQEVHLAPTNTEFGEFHMCRLTS